MKTFAAMFKNAFTVTAIIIFAMFLAWPGLAQDKPGVKKSKKVIKMNVVIDDDGKKTTTIDTTMVFPDSTMMDSIQKEIDKVIVIGKDGKHGHFRFHGCPRSFDYNFEMPPLPEFPFDSEDFEMPDMDMCMPGCEPGIRRLERHGQTLGDIIGDIPMSRVKSYTIKDTKNGKRITIEVDNAPLFESREKVVIIREPSKSPQPKSKSTEPGKSKETKPKI